MGHQLLGRLPRSKEWKQVVELLRGDANLEVVAAATSAAAERSMMDASDDHAVHHAFWLLTQLPFAASSDSFDRELGRLGVNVGPEPSLIEITTAMVAAIDRLVSRARHRSDFGEMAELCAAESLHAVIGRELTALFEPSAEDVRSAIARFATEKQFAVLARDFFSRLTRRHFAYFLSRELSNHVGAEQRFATMKEHRQFEDALDLHCREASRIIKEFSGEWYSKHNFEGGIDPEKAGRFVYVASRKIRDELQHRRGHVH